MATPLVLLVDDSEAVLAYERAALSGHYTIRTASNGLHALEELHARRPALVVLDLSMPVMDGDEVLARAKADPSLRDIPVVVVSSEIARGQACLAAGAAAFAPKPVRAPELLALVNRVYDEAKAARDSQSIPTLFVRVDAIELGLPVDRVRVVFHQPKTSHLDGAPECAREWLDLHGDPVCILDLAKCLGVKHAAPLVDRKIVVASDEQGVSLGLCVDDVTDPEEIDRSAFTPACEWKEEAPLPEKDALIGVLQTVRGARALVDPHALLGPAFRSQVSTLVRLAASGGAGR